MRGFRERDRTIRAAACVASSSTRHEAEQATISQPYHPDWLATMQKHYPGYEMWYNMTHKERRWELSLQGALEFCPKVPPKKLGSYGDDASCHIYMELLVDCPPNRLEEYNLPAPSALGESVLFVPLKLPEPPNPCKMWNTLLKEVYTHTHTHTHTHTYIYDTF
ncbi:OLC1v1014848C2 [Oldenlandia corymbosa var. corymbosa]|uniref:OLC1v1014848C2 n=2 Tax=Oldenlandia corymbosa var. corymbosa TaxID=529605 RepID=A0AAV1E1W0_OLDCO|nr:OLC1v1014848C2 [Oldenlandia corymbosa var. corymbosa]